MLSAPHLTVTDLLKGDIKLASPPSAYLELKRIVDDPGKTVMDAAKIIENDAALALRLLKIVNSAFYGLPSQVSSIATAISLIGTRELQNLVLATVVMERFSDLPGQVLSIHDFWAKNLRSALISRELDRLFGKQYADTAFLCGLVHNIGQLVMYRRIPVLAREVDLLIQSSPNPMIDEAEVEDHVIGFDHFALGAELCRLWKLPPMVIDSIALHRFPDHVGTHAGIATLTRLAHYFSRTESIHEGLALADGLELNEEQITAILNKIHDEFEVIFKLFYPAR